MALTRRLGIPAPEPIRIRVPAGIAWTASFAVASLSANRTTQSIDIVASRTSVTGYGLFHL